MTRTRLSYGVGLCLVYAATVHGQGFSPASLEAARAALHQAAESGQTAGGAHLVVHRGKVVHEVVAGMRDIDDKTPFQADTLVRIYSMSKPITSVGAMRLYEQGKFLLDDPVAQYIPAFEHMTVLTESGEQAPPRRPLTVRDVFRHTTGYSYGSGTPRVRAFYEKEGMLYRPPQGMFPPDMTIEQAADALARIPALHHPGERFTYGFNTDLLGRLIEVWSGQALDVYLQQAIFDPLQMRDTGFSVPPGKRNRFASCHTGQGAERVVVDKGVDSPFGEGFTFLSGGGGLVSTLPDYARFCRFMIDGGVFQGQRLLKEETVRLMFTDQLKGISGSFRFGLGFAIGEVTLGSGQSPRVATQYSWGGYASTDFRLVPEEQVFQIILQQQVPSSHNLANTLFPMMYQGME